MNPFKILFLSGPNPATGLMAERILKVLAGEAVQVFSAAGGRDVDDQAKEVMAEKGLSLTGYKIKKLTDLTGIFFDLIITLSEEARSQSRFFTMEKDRVRDLFLVSDPIRLSWHFPDPRQQKGGADKVLQAYRLLRDQLQTRLEGLANQGYLEALSRQRERRDLLLDSLDVGVMVHDSRRRISLFNRAAQRITGMKQEDVLGRDCHEALGPCGICGSNQCAFLDDPMRAMEPREYQVSYVNKGGEKKRLKMRVAPLDLGAEQGPGVLAIIRDVTEVTSLRRKLREETSFQGMIGVSPVMLAVFDTIRQVSFSNYPVLITGESGSGKELVAQAIHRESSRRNGPFVPVNCGALPEAILESELFGHVRGAFTGAIRDKKGRFELAHGGTLFLDEVGELSPVLQVKLLRVLQEKRFERLGGEETISVDVRIISATNRDLHQMVLDSRFRDDFYYRLRVIPIELPPLRERHEDLPLLVQHVLERINEETGKEISSVSEEVLDHFLRYSWPGNVREMINALQFASIYCQDQVLQVEHLPPEIRKGIGEPVLKRPVSPVSPVSQKDLDASIPLTKSRQGLTVDQVKRALDEAGGNKVLAAKFLGVGRATLYRFLRKHPQVSSS